MTDRVAARELSDSLDQVLELDTRARAAWLADLERHRPDLAAQLRELLAGRERIEALGFLEGVAAPGEAMPIPASLTGMRLGPWVIETEIGHGGMGSVWRARRDDGRIDALAAIKFVNLALLGRDGEQRFRREGLLLGRLNHPNIARLLDAGVHDESHQPYLVLEYVDGLPIDAWCESQQLGVRQRIALFLRVIEAVAHAHSHLIIHRDLKPSNILVTKQGDVKLLDFGIARLASGEDGAAHTRSSAAAMTPQYAAPEQVQGGLITTRTDVYALGLVLYRLLTGRHAVEFDTGASVEIFRAILERDPPPPSGASRASGVAGDELRGDLDNIVAKALRKASGERYASAGDLAQDLERFLRDEPVTARAYTVTYRVGKFVRRHRGGVAIASVALLAVFASLGVAMWQGSEARKQAALAREEAQRARDAGERAAAVRDFLFEVFAEARPSSPGASMPNASDVVHSAARRAREDAGMNALARTELLTNLAGVLGSQGDVVAYRDLLKETYADATSRLGQNHEATLRAGRGLVQALGLTGDRAGARVLIEELRPRVPPELGALRASLLSLSSQLHVGAGAYELALPEALQAVEICRRDCSMEVLSDALTVLANARANADDPAGAIEVWEEQLALERRHYGDRHVRVAATMTGMSRALLRNGDLQRAEEMVRSALQIRKAVLGADDLSLALDYNALMAILRTRRDYDGALAAALEAARIARVTGGPDHHQLEVNLAAVGTLHTLMGQPREALAPLAEAIRINERIRGPEHFRTATARGSYGEALARSGNWLEGAAQLRRAIRSFEQADGRDPEFESATIAKLARLQLERGDPASALGLFQAMARSAQTRGSRGVNQQARAAAGEARSLAAMGRNEAAAAALTRARALTVDLTPSDAELQIDLQLLDVLMALRNGDMASARQGLVQSQTALRSLPYPPAILSLAVAEIEGLLR